MTQKQVCQLDAESYFVGFTFADESPLEPGVYLLPAGAVDAPAPVIPEGHNAEWAGQWVYEPIPEPEPEPPETPEPEPIPADELRKIAYREESDPLFFKVQRGEATEQEWLDKIAEIKARYPKEQP